MKLSLLFFVPLSAALVVGCGRAAAPSVSSPPPPPPPAPSAGPASTAPVASAAPAVLAPEPAGPLAPVDVPRPHATALRVDRIVVARGVESREPVGVDTTFGSDDERVFAFVEVANPQRAPGRIQVQFVDPAGRAQPAVDLTVGDVPRFRTWAFTRKAHAPGTWKARIKDERGHVLAETLFDVKA